MTQPISTVLRMRSPVPVRTPPLRQAFWASAALGHRSVLTFFSKPPTPHHEQNMGPHVQNATLSAYITKSRVNQWPKPIRSPSKSNQTYMAFESASNLTLKVMNSGRRKFHRSDIAQRKAES